MSLHTWAQGPGPLDPLDPGPWAWSNAPRLWAWSMGGHTLIPQPLCGHTLIPHSPCAAIPLLHSLCVAIPGPGTIWGLWGPWGAVGQVALVLCCSVALKGKLHRCRQCIASSFELRFLQLVVLVEAFSRTTLSSVENVVKSVLMQRAAMRKLM